MFYSLQQVSDHPCFAMQELIYSVFYNAIQDEPFGKNVFPYQFTKTKSLWGYLRSIKDEFEKLYAVLLALDVSERKRIYSQLCDNNMIEIYCENKSIQPDNHLDFDKGIGKQIKDIVALCYKKLDLSHFRRPGCKIKPTHRYYRDYIKLNKSVCPFCSIESYKNPRSPRREDFDHYLCKSKYPLAAANMHNLVPMCNVCNQDYKKSEDMLYDNGKRVEAFYPFSGYSGVVVEIYSKLDPKPPYGRTWFVNLVVNNPYENKKVKNWNRIFSIKSRLVNEINEFYEEWMELALDECTGKRFNSVNSFRIFMRKRSIIENKRSNRRNEPKALLKSAFFKFVEKKADDKFIESYIQMHNEVID